MVKTQHESDLFCRIGWDYEWCSQLLTSQSRKKLRNSETDPSVKAGQGTNVSLFLRAEVLRLEMANDVKFITWIVVVRCDVVVYCSTVLWKSHWIYLEFTEELCTYVNSWFYYITMQYNIYKIWTACNKHTSVNKKSCFSWGWITTTHVDWILLWHRYPK